jgi:hypothetical protein
MQAGAQLISVRLRALQTRFEQRSFASVFLRVSLAPKNILAWLTPCE